MSTTWIPDAAAMASIRRGIADAEAGRTVSLDEAKQEWLQSAEEDEKSSKVDIILSAVGIGLGIGVAVGFMMSNTSSLGGRREKLLGGASAAEDVHRRSEAVRG